MDAFKKISGKGILTIPAAMRRAYGIGEGEKVRLEVDGQGKLIVSRIEGSCIFCKAGKQLKVLNGRFVCSDCIRSLTML